MWYCSEEIQVRQALFFAGASSAGAFGGLLAYAIGLMDGTRGLHGWQWLFLLEGVATVVIAVLAVFLIYDFPDTASFLTEEERAFVTWRLKYQSSTRSAPEPGSDGEEGTQQALVAEADEFQWKYIKQAFSDWQIYLSLLTYWGVSASLASNHPRSMLTHVCCRLCVRSTALASSCLPSSETWATRRIRPSS